MYKILENKEEFERTISGLIKTYEEFIVEQPHRAKEWEDVIWGMHRIMWLLDVNIEENNAIL